ncbi:3-deoxy-7-phosphoheptulonate synthase [Salinisphaera sp. T31B1]|uniref:3-deoxy-7-phosphoheptulonate synthase n=1 Tax=Salinisphaera sp. T31B1 TaxID=727963 RepID=UPI00334283A5
MNTRVATVHNDLETVLSPPDVAAGQARTSRCLPSPAELRRELALPEPVIAQIHAHRQAVRDVIHGRDERLLVIVGPCSLHDAHAALAYGRRLAALADQLGDRLLIVMRAYVEKPRTTVGWKGLMHDPGLDDGQNLAGGLRAARALLVELAQLGLPVASEILTPTAASYIEDTLSWAAIGARTTESQTHRETVSGLAMPVGFKNGTDGDVASARDALRAAAHAHVHMGIDDAGRAAAIHTPGNPDTHVILRGGRTGANCDAVSVAGAVRTLQAARLNPRLIIDCSHANSGKDPSRQPAILADIFARRRDGEQAIAGVMIESHLNSGNQPISSALHYGVSITDACLGWAETRQALVRLAADR